MSEHDGSGEIKETKEDKFKKDPDRFIDVDTLIVAVGRSDKGMTIFLQARSRGELTKALGEMEIAITKEVIKFDGLVAMSKSKIVNPGGIMNFVRNKRFNK